jgi:hypothetical protein
VDSGDWRVGDEHRLDQSIGLVAILLRQLGIRQFGVDLTPVCEWAIGIYAVFELTKSAPLVAGR